jgi:hypothetical protein
MMIVREATITDVVAAIVAIIVISATVFLACSGEAQAQTALTGLAGAVSSYFLTSKLKGSVPSVTGSVSATP